MNLHRNALAPLLVAASLSTVVGRAYAGPLSASISLRDAMPQTVETVQWRGGDWRGGWRGRWGGGWRAGWGGVGLGLAAGTLVGGALAGPYYGGYGYYSSPYYGDRYDYGCDDYAPTYSKKGGGYGG